MTEDINFNHGKALQGGKGPQLTFDKNFLNMIGQLNEIKQDRVVIQNIGSTTVTYQWKKNIRNDHIPSKSSDFVKRFYCHYPRSILKPGESKTFTFSFKSDKAGMFNEEWALLTEPNLLNPLPLISLSGIALSDDQYNEKRDQFVQEFEQKYKEADVNEVVDDLIDRVKTPEPEEEDLRQPQVFKPVFEKLNRHLGLQFSQDCMEGFYELIQFVRERYGKENNGSELQFEWSGSCEELVDQINSLQNPYTRQTLMDRYVQLLYQSKKVPLERAQSYCVLKKMLTQSLDQIIDLDAKIREETAMHEAADFEVIPEEQTEEERHKIIEEAKAKKAEALKKSKKKPKTEEEEKAELDNLLTTLASSLGSHIVNECVDQAEQEIELLKTELLMKEHNKMDKDAYDELNRKVSIVDIEIGEHDLILRQDLDIALSPYIAPEEPTKQHQTTDDAEHNVTSNSKRGEKSRKKKKEEEAHLEEVQPVVEPWKQRKIMDHTLIKRTGATLKYCQEHLAKRVFVIGNLAEKSGRVKMENSMQAIMGALQYEINDQQVIFMNEQAMDQLNDLEELREGCVYLCENLNFRPDEHSYVEPFQEKKEAPKEEKKEDQHESSQKKEEVKNAKPVDPKKMTPAEKKKWEEEQKKKASIQTNEDQSQQDSSANRAAKERELELQRIREAEIAERKKLEHFDYKTTFRYLNRLGKQFGQIYVNDAPLSCLSTSNSIAEIQCSRKVMGLKMTEDLRKLTQFFLTEFPLDINARHKKQPEFQDYFNNKFAVILGGICKNTTDILDKILLANSFLDTASMIYLVGEIGLVAVYALGLQVSKVDRICNQSVDYERVKGFVVQLLEKAAQRNVQIILPQDFIIGPKIDLNAPQEVVEEEKEEQTNEAVKDEKNKKDTKANAKDQKSKDNKDKSHEMSGGQNTSQQKEQTLEDYKVEQVDYDRYKDWHWSDFVVETNRTTVIDLEDQVDHAMQEISNKANQQTLQLDTMQQANSAENISNVALSETKQNVASDNASHKNDDDEAEENKEEVPQKPAMNTENYLIQYGPKTMAALYYAINNSFKLLWDGSISMFRETTKSSSTNKHFLLNLLEMRESTQEQESPPVTLIHGHETEQVLRESLKRIKFEQQEELEAKQRALEEAHDDYGDDDEDEMQDLEESREEISTFQEDLETICDFMVHDATAFTTKLMQGVPIRSIYSFDEHKKPSQQQMAEDLQLLEEI